MADGGEDHARHFSLIPVSTDLLALVQEQWRIFQQWLRRFHAGAAALDTHPAGTHLRYDALEGEIQAAPAQASSLPQHYTAHFRERPGQETVPVGMPCAWEAQWLPCPV